MSPNLFTFDSCHRLAVMNALVPTGCLFCEKTVGFSTTCLKSYWTIDAFKVTLVSMPKVCKLATVFAFVAQLLVF